MNQTQIQSEDSYTITVPTGHLAWQVVLTVLRVNNRVTPLMPYLP